MTDRYCVFGNPIGHSKSPLIHARFAALTGQSIDYQATLVARDGFAAALAEFVAAGGRGANVTVPFKEEAFRLCQQLTPRAAAAGAVNTLVCGAAGLLGDNTDGAGLVRDLCVNHGLQLAGKRLLLCGAGGAARGCLAPLVALLPASLNIANTTPAKAATLAALAPAGLRVQAGAYAELAGQEFDLVINATSVSLNNGVLPLPSGIFAPDAFAYDMMYQAGTTSFLAQAQKLGATRTADGLGMLVEQAAEAFALWRGVRPPTAPVLAELRAMLGKD